MLKDKNIVCLSNHYWNEAWFRKQHFMSRFAKNGNRILYVEPTFSMVRKPHKDVAKNRFFKPILEKVDENIFVLKPPQALPKWTNPTISRLNYIWFAKIIDRVARRLGMVDYILWIYTPEYFTTLKYFSYKKIVFDLIDDLAAYRGIKDSIYHYKTECINGLIKKSDLFIVTAKTLFNCYKGRSNNIVHIPNGFDSKLFFETGNRGVPGDLKNIKRPIVGFVGVLFSFLDYDLINYIADKNRDWSIVLVGAIEPYGTRDAIKELKKRENIYFLGKKKKEEIPAYINQFDVCINPFKVSEASRSVNPLKVYEYLACGKPVVSVRMQALEEESISGVIDFAGSYEDFANKVQCWVQDDSSDKRKQRVERVRDYSWDSLFTRVNEACNILKN